MNQKNFANIILIVVIVTLAGAVGYFAFVKKSEPITQQSTPTTTQATIPTPTQQVTIAEHIAAFEEAVNKSDFSNASKYFADKVYVVLEGSSCCGADKIYGKSPCCGEVAASRAKQELEKIKGLAFTFNPNDAVVKEYMDYMAVEYPNRRFIKTIPNKLYFDELSVGVESDVSQQNKASIAYKVSNDKITALFINVGRDR